MHNPIERHDSRDRTGFRLEGQPNAIRRLLTFALFCIAFTAAPLLQAATPLVPDERDREVLESLLLHLLNDPKFDLTRATTNGIKIVLNARTPEKTGFLREGQIRAELRSRTLPNGAEADLRRRNTPANVGPESYDAVDASYTNLTFAAGIVVSDLNESRESGRRSLFWFREAYPDACGYLRAYLPGYSEDGTRAVVRATAGPSAHGAALTAVLEKQNGKWTVAWYHVAHFV